MTSSEKPKREQNYILACATCDESLALGQLLRNEVGRYFQIRLFLKKHRKHRLWFTGNIDRVEETEENLSKVALSTPEKRLRWLTATKLLLNALEEKYKKRDISK